MRKGFTILELLVASLLLGMLVTILTMIFNQSSIAWRTGVAGVAQMDEVRDNIAEVREEADNFFVSGSKVGRITSLWNKNGQLRSRACAIRGESGTEDDDKLVYLGSLIGKNTTQQQFGTISVGSGGSSGASFKTYTVGVTSKGPDGQYDTYDDITSWPDIIE